jgi:hypothetical protein
MVRGRSGVDLDDIFVLTEEQPLVFVESILLHLFIALVCIPGLGERLIVKWVQHAFLVLHNSLHDEIFIHDEDIAEASFTSSLQAFDVLFSYYLAATDLHNQWV